jgi:hypothetical protein
MRKKFGKIGRALIGMMLFMSVIAVFVLPVEAAGDTYMGVTASAAYVEVGDTFNVTVYLDPGSDTVDAWKVYNFTYDYERKGIINATAVEVKGWWYEGGFSDPGSINNNLSVITSSPTALQAFRAGGTSNNYTAFVVNYTALDVGTVYLNLSSVRMVDGGVTVTNTTINDTIIVYPQDPASFSVTTINYSAINLTWTAGTGDDQVTVCGKTGSYPSSPSDSVIYNGTAIGYNHSDLLNCTTYYYRAWGWNSTANMHSIDYRSGTATTWCYTNISFASPTPANQTVLANCSYDQTVNVTVENSRGRTCLYWINASDGSTTSGSVLNNTISLALTSLAHNTTFWWNVTASEQGVYGSGDSDSVSYWFTTGVGGGTAPTGSNPSPSNGASSVAISPVTFSMDVADVDGDPANVSFIFSDGTYIGDHNLTYPGNTATATYTTALNYNTTYQWYALVNDTSGCGQSTRYPTASYYSFTTDEQIVTLSKEWHVTSNNTLTVWANVSNVGEVDLENGYLNETWDYDYLTLVGATQGNDGTDPGRFNITSLPQAGTWEVQMWFSIRAPMPNGTSLSDTATINFNSTDLNTFTPSTLPTMCFYATKEWNQSVLYWYTDSVTFWVNVTNCGDFYMNWTQVNESYSDNFTYSSSSITPNGTNETFNITTPIAPSGTASMWIIVNKTAAEYVNGTNVYNNVTIGCNESSSRTTFTSSAPVGAITSQLRITYVAQLTEVTGFGNTVLTILGVLLILSAIFLIIVVVTRGGFSGGGE